MERAELRRAAGQRARRGAAASSSSCWRRACWSGAGLYQVHQAKTQGLADVDAGLAAKRLLNLNDLGAREDLLPALSPLFPKLRERDTAAREIYYLTGSLSNVGGIAHKKLLTGEQFRQLKPLLVVRRPAQFQRAFYLWCGIFFAAFWLVHLWWSVRGFRGDQTFLPALLALSGIGLILMVSLRDPVRDNLLFVDFAQGAAAGVVLLAALSGFDYQRLTGKLSFVPLLVSFALSVLLVLFGTGPGHQRRQGQPLRFPAGGNHPRAAGLLPRRLLRAALGRAAPRARNASLRWRRLPASSTFRRWNTRCPCWFRWRFRWSSSSCKRTWARRWSSPACS